MIYLAKSVSWKITNNGNEIGARKSFGIHWNGTIMFRYRLNSAVEDGFTISILYNDKTVVSVYLKGPVYDEPCHCPDELETFYKKYNCPDTYSQLEQAMIHYYSRSCTV